MNSRHAVLVLLVLLLAWTARAQRIDPAVVAVSGGFAQTASVSVSWTVGQSATDLRAGHFGTLSEGFQQAFLTVIPVREISLPFSLDLYPNPVHHSVLVTVTGLEGEMTLVLFNLLGEPVIRQQVRSGDQHLRLSLETLSSGLYLLAAFSGSGEQMGLYKIVKAE
jgi:hypothetical protein